MAWNRPTSASSSKSSGDSPRKVGPRKPRRWQMGVAAGCVVILAGIIGWWFFDRQPQTSEDIPKTTMAKPTRTAAVNSPVRQIKRTKWRPKTKPEATARLTPPARMTKDIVELGALPSNCILKAAVFKHQSEGLIAGILTAVPGDHFLTSAWDANFDADLAKALEDPTPINDDDDEETRQLKEAVELAKRSLKAYIGSDIKPHEVMAEAQAEIEKITAYRDQLDDAMQEYVRSGNMADAIVFCKEANQLLGEYNAKPLRISQKRLDKYYESLNRQEEIK